MGAARRFRSQRETGWEPAEQSSLSTIRGRPVRLIGNAYLRLALKGGDLIAAHNLANAYHTDQTLSDG